MIEKDYGGWQIRKLALNSHESVRYFYEREIWWAAIGHNVGVEEDGKLPNFARPVLVFRKFSQSLFYGLPLSTTKKTGRYYYPIKILGVEDKILLTHMRALDSKRLINVISREDYDAICEQMRNVLSL